MNWFHRKVCRSDRWRRRLATELLPWTLKDVELGDDLLELGPGPGLTTDFLRQRQCRLTVLEVDGGMADALRHRLSGAGVRVVEGDGTAMPFPDRSFSGVVAFTMLHHVSTRELQNRLFSEAMRVLRGQGIFAGVDGIDSFPFRLVHWGDCYTPVDPNSLGNRLQAAGFTDVAVERGGGRFRFSARRP